MPVFRCWLQHVFAPIQSALHSRPAGGLGLVVPSYGDRHRRGCRRSRCRRSSSSSGRTGWTEGEGRWELVLHSLSQHLTDPSEREGASECVLEEGLRRLFSDAKT